MDLGRDLEKERENVTHSDFKKAKDKVMFKKKEGVPEGLYIDCTVPSQKGKNVVAKH
ncbi:hypothetical protein CsSME_00003019 [Camellia sinensis var. sinensis]